MDAAHSILHVRVRYGLRTLLFAFAILAAVLAWSGHRDRQRKAMRYWILQHGGSIFPEDGVRGTIILPREATLADAQQINRLFPGSAIYPNELRSK
jgi:hypothetical protein